MTIEISKSYPFRSIAAKYDLPYWAVLCYADYYEAMINRSYKDIINIYWIDLAITKIQYLSRHSISDMCDDIATALRAHGRIK